MHCISASIPYKQTGYFSKIITDYLDQSASLQPFYVHPVSLKGLEETITARKQFNTDRRLLVEELEKQYKLVPPSEKTAANIKRLSDDNTFTIVTAHQPNIFTGHLYFIYKILHTIKLADTLKQQLPQYHFVPVFYMGSEDADLDELGHIFINGEKISWDTKQEGAVGRMSVKGLDKLIARIEGELSVEKHGPELIALLKECYTPDADIQTATFRLINKLFTDYGLVVLLPDDPSLKRSMLSVFKDDLWQQTPSDIVTKTTEQLSEKYKVQANPRDINLFYLKDNIRERIVKNGKEWKVVGHDIRFTEKELEQELQQHPERFSPNVILRGLYQETILPTIAFIGGGGELAYWLELKDLFEHYKVPFPVLVLRNSFLLVEKKWEEKIEKLGFTAADLFKEEQLLIDDLVKRSSSKKLDLTKEIGDVKDFYHQLKGSTIKIDKSLEKHIEGLEVKAIKQLQKLEKKLIKAERKKFDAAQRQIGAIKEKLFPKNNLQERVDNFMPFYAKEGKTFLDTIYAHSPVLEQKFTLIL